MPLVEIAIFLAAAVVAVPLFQRAGLGTVLGFLAAGALIGPSGLALIDGVDAVLHVAEFGVVLLLFLIGLELQPSRLWRMRREVFGFGVAQVLGTTAVLAPCGMALGLSATTAIVVAFALSLSSTAFVLQLLGERNELATAHGRAAFGILLFQDLAAIPVLAIVPLLGNGPTTAPTQTLVTRILIVVGVVVAIVVAGRFLLRPIFRIVAQTRSRELSAAWALLVVVATALAMEEAGLSMALGAFMAGVLLADSEYRHEAEANVEPFKGLLLGLFFMAVGMSANTGVVLAQPLLVLGLTLGLVLAKGLVLFALGRGVGLGGDGARNLALSLSQGGEFAFVLLGVTEQATLLPSATTQILVVVVTLSMAATPALLAINDALVRRRRVEAAPFDEIAPPAEGTVIIAGFGRFGQIISRVLHLKHIASTALEVNPSHVDFVRRFGNELYYGDASRVDLLRAAGIEKARLFVLAIDDPEASVRTAQVVRENFPSLHIVARARNRQHAHALIALGVEYVIRETYLSSLDAAVRVLEEVGLSTSQARDAVHRFRQYDEDLLLRQVEIRDDEKKLIEMARNVAVELEELFEEDAKQ